MVRTRSISVLRGIALIAAVTVVAAVIGVSLISMVGTANADPYKWCAVFTQGGTNCGFVTFEQCQATISGIGGSCDPNPSFTGRQAPVGHRQPRLKDLPADVLQREQTPKPEKPDKHQTICRGC